MRILQETIISAGDIAGNPVPTSAAIDASSIYSVSTQCVTVGSSPTGTLKLQCSNDKVNAANLALDTVPTNWSDIPNASVAVSAAGVTLIPKTDICYQWIRAIWTQTSGTGTITVNLKTLGLG